VTVEPTCVVLRNDVSDLPRAHEALHAWLRDRGADADLQFDADLVLEEIVTNLVKYAWPGGGEHHIVFTFDDREGHVTLRFEDDGRPFDPRSAPQPVFPDSLDRCRTGGLGLHLVRTVAARIDYRSEAGNNHLVVHLRR
jgi:serine/threonine-protein kinase RsbW